jgi:putative NADH-flavin reductase
MQLAIFGATGRTGVALVHQALERGHLVRALVRSTAKAEELLPTSAGSLRLITGDLLDGDAAAKTIVGTEAVLNVAGPVRGAPPDLQQRAIGHVIAGMQATDVRRLITLTGAGVRMPGDRPKVADRVIRTALQLMQGKMLADAVAYVEAVRASDLDWTVVRAPRLTDGEPRGTYRASPHVGGDSSTRIGRADLATAMLDLLEDPGAIGQAPVVTW